MKIRLEHKVTITDRQGDRLEVDSLNGPRPIMISTFDHVDGWAAVLLTRDQTLELIVTLAAALKDDERDEE